MKIFIRINGIVIILLGILFMLSSIFRIMPLSYELINASNVQEFFSNHFSGIINLCLFIMFSVYSLFQGICMLRNTRLGMLLTFYMPLIYVFFIVSFQGEWNKSVYLVLVYSIFLAVVAKKISRDE